MFSTRKAGSTLVLVSLITVAVTGSVHARPKRASKQSIVTGVTVPLNPRETFYSTFNDAVPALQAYSAPSTPIDLNQLGLNPGDEINLTRLGGYYHTFPEWSPVVVTPLMGIFSSTDQITTTDDTVAPQPVQRIPGAISVGEDVAIGNILGTEFTRELAEDFQISYWTTDPSQPIGRNIVIPAGARYLFLAGGDSPTWDNSPSPLGYNLRITLVRATYPTLIQMTRQYVASPSRANSLCVKLQEAVAAAARGNARAATQMVRMYIREVNTQGGKAINSNDAAVLVYFAERL